MAGSELMQVDGDAVGAWIEPGLDGFGGMVKQQIPQVYEAYARIFHPASDEEGKPVAWGMVAEALGTTAHREMRDPGGAHRDPRGTATSESAPFTPG